MSKSHSFPFEPSVDHLARAISATPTMSVAGRVSSLVGLSLRARAPGVRVGELVEIDREGEPLLAEVVGFDGAEATLMPLGTLDGVGATDVVRPTGRRLSIPCSDALLGRVLDGLGRPVDGGPPLALGAGSAEQPVTRRPPPPLSRPRISKRLETGVRAIDGLLTVGEGQRVGLFAGSGVGKSTLLGQIARQSEADVFVACLIGERGRELREFLDDSLGEEGMRRGVVVCATSDAPAMVRMKSAHVATAIAEYFRDRGKRVLLLMDSLSRFARAAREVGLAAGEAPARRGYPPSAFAALPELLERTGTSSRGTITAIYTVLVEGGDMEEPVADEVRGILDGHIILDRAIATRGRLPAIDVAASLSRVMPAITDERQRSLATSLRQHLAAFEEKRDLIHLGAYQAGSDPRVDAAIQRVPGIEAFLRQPATERIPFAETLAALARASSAPGAG